MISQMPHPNAPRKAPRQSRSQMTVNAILDATAHIFIANGYAKTNTNIIAEHAGVSIGSLYQYFPNKDALIEALHQRHVERMQKVVRQAMKEPIDFKNRNSLFSLIAAIVKAHLLEPELHLKFEEIKTLKRWSPTDGSDLGGIQQQLEHMISSLPKNAGHHSKKLSAFILMHTVHALVHAIAFKRPPDVSVKAMIEETVSMVERYLEVV